MQRIKEGTIHEKQTRQFCAVHTVNNLLQIPRTGEEGPINEEFDGICQRWTCNGHVLEEADRMTSSSSVIWRAATQTEFDDIAQEITLRERQLTKSTDNDNESLTLWQRLWSHHGTPFFGNYSLEALQLALERRDVDLNYFRVPEQGEDAGCDNNGTKSVHIGYVIYEQGHSYSTYLKRIGGYIPVIKHFFQGKHWYAITQVQYSCKANCDNTVSPIEKIVKPHWCLVDSKLDEVTFVNSDKALLDLLRRIQNSGGLVFRATFLTRDN